MSVTLAVTTTNRARTLTMMRRVASTPSILGMIRSIRIGRACRLDSDQGLSARQRGPGDHVRLPLQMTRRMASTAKGHVIDNGDSHPRARRSNPPPLG